jgi:HNH endonuclease.
MRKTALKRKSKKSTATLRNKCDALLTPIIKKMRPRCEACGHDTEVAHHWIEKSRSSYLRYDFRNLVALCHSCHTKIHNRFGNSVMGSLDVADIIIGKRGVGWKQEMVRDSVKDVKTDLQFYVGHLENLQELLASME